MELGVGHGTNLPKRARDPIVALGKVMPNHALERSVTELQQCAAGAWNDFAPAAHSVGLMRPAQRGR